MSTDFRQIQLTEQQQMWVAQLADQTGKPWTEVLEERLLPEAAMASDAVQGQGCVRDPEKWLARFNAWVSRQRSWNPDVDDSRESIYP